jgi:hypothetical protein
LIPCCSGTFISYPTHVKLISRILLAGLAGFLFSLGFAFFFLDLFDRPRLDQALLLLLPTGALSWIIFSIIQMPKEKLPSGLKFSMASADVSAFIREHLAGLLLAFLFFCAYFYIGLRLNPIDLDTVDNFLDADNSAWMQRIADPDGGSLEMRGPHPFAYLIFRPFGLLLDLFTRNFAQAAILLNAFAGGLCVFLTWIYFKRHTQNAVYAFLIAGLLGLSTAHFFFGSVVETYIFSALFLILFFVLLQRNDSSMGSLIFVSLITFGITLTNFIQTLIGLVVTRPRIKEVIRFAGLTLSLGIILSLVHAALYPASKLFFLPADAQTEEEFAFSPVGEPSWRVIGRGILLIRTVFLYALIAPRPYVFVNEVGGTFPRFNFFKIAPETFSYSSYDGLGNLLILVWAILLFVAGMLFLIDLVRTRKVDIRLGLLLCVLFNFCLHLYYGYEPFLYSPDWAYALIFFTALSFAPLAGNRIFQTGLFLFLAGLVVNQVQFFQFIFNTIAPFLK